MKTAMRQIRNSRTMKTTLATAFACLVAMGTTANAALALGFAGGDI